MAALPDELIAQLVKAANSKSGIEKSDTIVYGTIVSDGSQQYVQLDGSDCLTPAVSLVEINPEERVAVSIGNHTATILGNATNPSVGIKTAEGLRSEISQTAAEIRILVEDTINDMQSSIKVNADNITSLVRNQDVFTEFKQTVEGFTFMGTGGTIKISLNDLSSDVNSAIQNATPKYQYSANGLTNWVDWSSGMDISSYKFRRESYDGGVNWTGAYQFVGTDGANGSSASVTYSNIKSALNRASNAAMTIVTGSSIDTVDIYANDIYGGNFYAGNGSDTFATMNDNGFFVYRDSNANPKIMLAVDDDDTVVKLVLGSGTTNIYDTNGRLFVEKTRNDEAGIYFYDTYGEKCGIRFTSGRVSLLGGELSSTATFG